MFRALGLWVGLLGLGLAFFGAGAALAADDANAVNEADPAAVNPTDPASVRATDLSSRAGAELGTIYGQLFTARDADSLAAGAKLTLIFKSADGELQRIDGFATDRGEYRFDAVSTDPQIQYVIKVEHFGRDYLGSPMQFAAGTRELEFNFLVARDANPLEAPPPDHHEHRDPRFGEPVEDDPFLTLAIVGFILALFVLPIHLTHNRERGQFAEARAGHARLVRDIASLDLRFEAGEIAEPEYSAIRRQLFAKLKAESGSAQIA